jgi:hypothetical protein
VVDQNYIPFAARSSLVDILPLSCDIGDKGYVSRPLSEAPYGEGAQPVTELKRGMRDRLMPVTDKVMPRKRAIIESVMDRLKDISQIEHGRHGGVADCFVDLAAGLTAYTWRGKKPSLNIRLKERSQLVF